MMQERIQESIGLPPRMKLSMPKLSAEKKMELRMQAALFNAPIADYTRVIDQKTVFATALKEMKLEEKECGFGKELDFESDSESDCATEFDDDVEEMSPKKSEDSESMFDSEFKDVQSPSMPKMKVGLMMLGNLNKAKVETPNPSANHKPSFPKNLAVFQTPSE